MILLAGNGVGNLGVDMAAFCELHPTSPACGGAAAAPRPADPRAGLTTVQGTVAIAQSQGTRYNQQDLTPAAKQFFSDRGISVDCRIDPNWFAGPQGGQPNRLCSIDGGGYDHAGYLLNLNPSVALTERRRAEAMERAAADPQSPTFGAPLGSGVFQTAAGSAAVNAQLDQIATEKGPAVGAPASSPPAPPGAGVPAGPGIDPAPPPAAAPVPPQDQGLPFEDFGAQYLAFLPPDLLATATDQWINGIPNWALLAAGVATLYMATKRR